MSLVVENMRLAPITLVFIAEIKWSEYLFYMDGWNAKSGTGENVAHYISIRHDGLLVGDHGKRNNPDYIRILNKANI